MRSQWRWLAAAAGVRIHVELRASELAQLLQLAAPMTVVPHQRAARSAAALMSGLACVALYGTVAFGQDAGAPSERPPPGEPQEQAAGTPGASEQPSADTSRPPAHEDPALTESTSGTAATSLTAQTARPVVKSAGTPEGKSAGIFGMPWRLELRPGGRYRSSPTTSDVDFSGLVRAELGDLRGGRLRAYTLVQVKWDADGAAPVGGDDLSDLGDGPGSTYLRIYHAVAELSDLGLIALARGGRMYIDGTPEWVHLDGAFVRTRALGAAVGFTLEAHAGVPVRYHQRERLSEYSAGAALIARPWRTARVRADWQLLGDETDAYGPGQMNHIYGVSFSQLVGDRLFASAAAHGLGRRARDMSATARFTHDNAGLSLQASYFQLLSTRRQLALSADHLEGVLYEEHKFRRLSLVADKALGQHLSIGAGADVRQLLDPDVSGPLSHSYQRYWLGPFARGWPSEAIDLQVTAELWTAPTGDGAYMLSAGGIASYRPSADLEFRVGSDYARYRYDFFLGEEHEDSRRFHGGVRARLRSAGIDGRVRYELEDTSTGRFHTVWLTLGLVL